MDSFYNDKELRELGLKKYGTNVKISRKASIYSPEKIEIGSNVRIDDFCILSGKITLGNYIHIAAYAAFFGGTAGIELEDFAATSARTTVYAASDDYSGEYMANPLIADKYRNVQSEKVVLRKHALVGAGCIILPGAEIGEGASIGAMSLINHDIEPWTINVGIPAKKKKERSKRLLELENDFLWEQKDAKI